jgi:hypothetical protein
MHAAHYAVQKAPPRCPIHDGRNHEHRLHRRGIKPTGSAKPFPWTPFFPQPLSSPPRAPHQRAPSIPRAAELEERRRSRGRWRRFWSTSTISLCSLPAPFSSSARSEPHPAPRFLSGSARTSPSSTEPEDHADEHGHAPPRAPPSASFGRGGDFGETAATLQPPQLPSMPLGEPCPAFPSS